MCWGAGILLSSGVVRAVVSVPGDWGELVSLTLTDNRMASAFHVSMGLADSSLHRGLLCARIPLERCPKGQAGTGKGFIDAT